MVVGFSSQKYIKAQKKEIQKRLKKFDRLYLEIGGKICYDGHASRVLPGYKPETKINFLKSLTNLSLIYCVNAEDLQSNRILGDKRLNYEQQTFSDLKVLDKAKINSVVVITKYSKEPKAYELKKKLENLGKKVYFHKRIEGYYYDLDKILNGFSKQQYIPVKTKLVVVSGPAGNSGKMATALSQIYHELRQGQKSGFAKYETFPIWNLPLNHPINIAYEAATADLQDRVMIDSYHFKAYKIKSVNYNRDIKNFGILIKLIQKITKQKIPFGYKSPTDMGINMLKQGIINDKICREAAIREIHRRSDFYKQEYAKGRESKKTIQRMDEILKKI